MWRGRRLREARGLSPAGVGVGRNRIHRANSLYQAHPHTLECRRPHNREPHIPPAGAAAKLAPYSAVRAKRITKVDLAGRLGVSVSAARKPTNPAVPRRGDACVARGMGPLAWGSPAPRHPSSSHP